MLTMEARIAARNDLLERRTIYLATADARELEPWLTAQGIAVTIEPTTSHARVTIAREEVAR